METGKYGSRRSPLLPAATSNELQVTDGMPSWVPQPSPSVPVTFLPDPHHRTF